MRPEAAEIIVRLAALAALADGAHDEREREELEAAAERFGVTLGALAATSATSAPSEAARLARALESAAERETAYRTALAVAHADGYVNTQETIFLRSLADSLGIDAQALGADTARTSRELDAWAWPAAGEHAEGPAVEPRRAGPSGSLDAFILDQAIATAALELLPDGLANLAIIPVQLRMVHRIGEAHGATVDGPQVKALMATLGIGVLAQSLESAVRKTVGGLTGGLLGRLLGGAGGVAAGAAVSFATTYALGHVAERYYTQGQRLDAADLRALFTRLRGEADSLYPRVQQRIAARAQGASLSSLLQSLRGDPGRA